MTEHEHGGILETVALFTGIATIAIVYVLLVRRQLARSRHWSTQRTIVFLLGCAVLALGLQPRWLPYAEGDFRSHMLQHLLVGMLAPLGLVMAAPIKLAMRSLPGRWGRAISSFLRSRPLGLIANPVTALALNLGGMAALYFTPLYTAMMLHPVLHAVVHFHFLAAGCLYTWVIAGPDPAPYRASVPARLVMLGTAVLIHSVLAQLLYAGAFVHVPASPAQLQGGAELMYYGGDITEMLLAVALVITWRPAPAVLRTTSSA